MDGTGDFQAFVYVMIWFIIQLYQRFFLNNLMDIRFFSRLPKKKVKGDERFRENKKESKYFQVVDSLGSETLFK